MIHQTIALAIVTVVAALAVPATAGQSQAPPPGPPTPPPNYVYAAEGRRDPFVDLVNRGVPEGAPATARPVGAAGLRVNELVVRGIVNTREGFVAMVGGPDGRTHTVRPGDRLLDGRIRAITPEALIILQEVNDPLSLEKQREVRKFLRGGGEEVR